VYASQQPLFPAHATRAIQIQWHVSKFSCDVIASPEQFSIYDDANADAIRDG